MIKAVFFDFDGVLTRNGNGSVQTCQYLAKETGLDAQKLIDCHYKQGLDLLLGKKSYADIWSEFCACVGTNINEDLLEPAFLSTPENSEMFNLASKVRAVAKVGVITDNAKERFEAVSRKFELAKRFDTLMLSADIGALKGEEAIFDAALRAVGVLPEEAVFIDNTQKNLVMPQKMGMATIFFDCKKNDVVGLAAELRSLGLDV